MLAKLYRRFLTPLALGYCALGAGLGVAMALSEPPPFDRLDGRQVQSVFVALVAVFAVGLPLLAWVWSRRRPARHLFLAVACVVAAFVHSAVTGGGFPSPVVSALACVGALWGLAVGLFALIVFMERHGRDARPSGRSHV
ncbi:MAG: hypothetical protein LBS56_08415 [Propionibacteriaceae bacterium]|jgi:hypothetical protein|nr:hypothetical protein [Propionibacteriaceae bacterium]